MAAISRSQSKAMYDLLRTPYLVLSYEIHRTRKQNKLVKYGADQMASGPDFPN